MKWSRTGSLLDHGRLFLALSVLLLGLECTELSFAQTAQSYRQQATELARAKSWDESIVASCAGSRPASSNASTTTSSNVWRIGFHSLTETFGRKPMALAFESNRRGFMKVLAASPLLAQLAARAIYEKSAAAI